MNSYKASKDYFLTNYEESVFLRLFEEVLRKSRGNVTDQEISDGVNCAIGNFKYGLANACAITNYTSSGSLLGYFYWYSPISAGLARHKTRNAMRKCEEFRSMFLRSSLKIVSVGGGTGSDLVGLCSAVYEECACHRLELTVVDNNWKWKPFFKTTERLLRTANFGDASHLFKNKLVNTSYMCADLADSSYAAYTNVLRDADIVWMKGVRSILRDDAERWKITETIISSMSPGALLVVIDPLYFGDFKMYRHELERVFTSKTGDQYKFMQTPTNIYGRGPFKPSNQEIIVFIRNENEYITLESISREFLESELQT